MQIKLHLMHCASIESKCVWYTIQERERQANEWIESGKAKQTHIYDMITSSLQSSCYCKYTLHMHMKYNMHSDNSKWWIPTKIRTLMVFVWYLIHDNNGCCRVLWALARVELQISWRFLLCASTFHGKSWQLFFGKNNISWYYKCRSAFS